MIRQFILLLNFIGLFLVHWYTGNVTIDENVPASAKAGSEFTVEVTINKGTIAGFARFQDELPAGFTATVVDAKSADFRFENQKVKFIWTSIPADKEVKVTYKVSVASSVPTGDYQINSKFSFIADNTSQNVVGVHPIHIDGESAAVVQTTTPKDTATHTNPVTNVVTPKDTNTSNPVNVVTNNPPKDTTKPANEVTIDRIVPQDASGEFVVEIHLKKGLINGFAKIEDELPSGCNAAPIKTAYSNFMFENNKVKFIWASLPPSSDELVLSYKVTMDQTVTDFVKIRGMFSYIDGDLPQSKQIYPSTVTVRVGGATTNPVTTNPVTTNPVTTNPVTTNPVTTNPITNTIPNAQPGVNFKVQIMALHRNIPNSYFSNAYHISEPISIDLHEGWTKYIVGGFDQYVAARDHREEVRGKGVVGPFVTAYNSGKRIPVQDALMIANQKWVR
jgi:hypothetical protein